MTREFDWDVADHAADGEDYDSSVTKNDQAINSAAPEAEMGQPECEE
jgi:hypothetical protein